MRYKQDISRAHREGRRRSRSPAVGSSFPATGLHVLSQIPIIPDSGSIPTLTIIGKGHIPTSLSQPSDAASGRQAPGVQVAFPVSVRVGHQVGRVSVNYKGGACRYQLCVDGDAYLCASPSASDFIPPRQTRLKSCFSAGMSFLAWFSNKCSEPKVCIHFHGLTSYTEGFRCFPGNTDSNTTRRQGRKTWF